MIFLAGSVICTVILFIVFRSFGIFNIDNLQGVVVNYMVCSLIGFFFINQDISTITETLLQNTHETWFYITLLLGIFFVLTFYLLALTTQKESATVGSVSFKMSFVIPAVTSIFWINDNYEYSFYTYLGVFLALLSVTLTSIKKEDKGFNWKYLYLPFLVFFLSGSIDATINYTNKFFLTTETQANFTFFLFLTASLFGIGSILLQVLLFNEKIRKKNVIGGIALGLPNYFSIFLLLKALSAYKNDGAFVFPVFNICVIVATAFTSILIFREKMAFINKIGIVLAVIALITLALTS